MDANNGPICTVPVWFPNVDHMGLSMWVPDRAWLQIPYGMPHIESHIGPMWVPYALMAG